MKCGFRVFGEKGNCFGLSVGCEKSTFFNLIDIYMTRFDSSSVYGGKYIYDRAFSCCFRNFCGL